MSFEDKCGIVGVAPLASGLCIATVADEGGAIVPITGTAHRTIPRVVEKQVIRKKHTMSCKLAKQMVDSDVMFARALQAEEQAAAEKIAAAVGEDERLAWSSSDTNFPPGSCADPTSPRTGHVPPTPPDSPSRVARPARASQNPYDILTSQSRQAGPDLVREAARTKEVRRKTQRPFE